MNNNLKMDNNKIKIMVKQIFWKDNWEEKYLRITESWQEEHYHKSLTFNNPNESSHWRTE